MTNPSQPRKRRSPQGITSITVQGYKSLIDPCVIDVSPLTILAGANSSGKSSIMQPILMLKQTLEATYDPGALLLHGPNVRFTSADQLFSKLTGKAAVNSFTVSLEIDSNQFIEIVYSKRPKKGIDILEERFSTGKNKQTILRPNMTKDEILSILPESMNDISRLFSGGKNGIYDWGIDRSRCFLTANLIPVDKARGSLDSSVLASIAYPATQEFSSQIRNLIHVPGLRGNPERTYKTTAIGSSFPGTFEDYVASVISHWQSTGDARLKSLSSSLETLGLTWKVEAKQIDDTQVELRVGRTLHGKRGGSKDTVNIADVGFGVSQTLPVLVALLVANKGQLVYIEQPEIHLHPRAQSAMAQLLADAANRGVRVVVETHSSLLLRGIQTQVAKNLISPDLVKLNWFKRRPEDGATEISSANLDSEGAFGDWPEDFDEVTLNSEREYLDATELKALNQ